MSKFSGKCDLYDHIYTIGTKGTNDNMTMLEKFNIFKERTKGVIYQSKKMILTSVNIDNEIKNVNNPNILSKFEWFENKKDSRCKGGFKTVNKCKYFYYNKEYESLDAINKIGYYARREIKFNKPDELIKYYPYTIGILSSDPDSEYVEISSKSYPTEHYWDSRLRSGVIMNEAYYTNELLEEYRKYYSGGYNNEN